MIKTHYFVVLRNCNVVLSCFYNFLKKYVVECPSVNNLVAVPAPTVRQQIIIRGYSNRYLVILTRTIVQQHSFYPDAKRLWNSILPSTVLCGSAESLSQHFQQIQLG